MPDQTDLTMSPPVDLDVEAAMDPKPTGYHHEKPHCTDHVRGSRTYSMTDEDVTEEQQKELAFYVGKLDPDEDPQNFSMLRKVVLLFVISTGALCSTCASSMVRTTALCNFHKVVLMS